MLNELQQRIIDAMLPTVVFDGWTEGTLARAAASIGISAFELKRAFPGGVAEAVDGFFAQADEQMLAALRRDHNLSSLKIRERIATAVMVRLHQLAPHREAVRRAQGFYALPWNSAAGVKALYRTVDAIWREAGDTSTDYNYYTKRLLLAKVLSTTQQIWLNDPSDELKETEAFLRRRIENVMQIEKFKAKARDNLGKLEGWLPKFGKRA